MKIKKKIFKCLHQYVKYSIESCNVLPINCPDSKCKYSGYLVDEEIRSILNDRYDTDINNNSYSSLEDIERLGEKVCFIEKDKYVDLYQKYLNLCNELKVLRDPSKIYCPRPICQNVCTIDNDNKSKIVCDKCSHEFCIECSKACNGSASDTCTCSSSGSNFNFENIKRCPNCSILIERADGCAQIMCKICKHTFCFYCLTSLEVF